MAERFVGLGAMRQIRAELRQAKDERKDIDQRIRRLRAAEAALYGRRPKRQVLDRELLRSYLAEHPGSRSLTIADELGAPISSVRTLLSTMKKDGEVVNQHMQWSLNAKTVG
jgi:septal ring factor EnvC (AmiA/AmiB activator)